MTLAGLFAALIALCGWLSIPAGEIAFTMQTLGVFLTLGLLGGKWGTVAIGIYLLLGVVGLPVFSGFQGGPGILAGVTGGFLWGFLLAGLVYLALERYGVLPAMIAGQAVCYLCGIFWFLQFSGGGFWFVFARCVAPFLIPDLLKLRLALYLTRRLRKYGIPNPSRT